MKDIAIAMLKREIETLEQMLEFGPPGVAALLPMVKGQLADKKEKLAELEGKV